MRVGWIMYKNKPVGIQITTKTSHWKKIKGSISKYDQPFEPVGDKNWEALLLEGFMPEMAHADELFIPTLKELGESPGEER